MQLDVAAKVLVDKLASLMCGPPSLSAKIDKTTRQCQQAYSAGLLPKLLRVLLMDVGDVITSIAQAIQTFAVRTLRLLPGCSTPQPKHRTQPHDRYGA